MLLTPERWLCSRKIPHPLLLSSSPLQPLQCSKALEGSGLAAVTGSEATQGTRHTVGSHELVVRNSFHFHTWFPLSGDPNMGNQGQTHTISRITSHPQPGQTCMPGFLIPRVDFFPKILFGSCTNRHMAVHLHARVISVPCQIWPTFKVRHSSPCSITGDVIWRIP